MAIKETYLAALKKVVPPGDIWIDLSPLRRGRGRSLLAPDPSLQKDWMDDRIPWKVFVERYYAQIQGNSEAMDFLNWLIEESLEKDIWLVCVEKTYPCHRFLVKRVVEGIHTARGFPLQPFQYDDLYTLYRNLYRSQIRGEMAREDISPFMSIKAPFLLEG